MKDSRSQMLPKTEGKTVKYEWNACRRFPGVRGWRSRALDPRRAKFTIYKIGGHRIDLTRIKGVLGDTC